MRLTRTQFRIYVIQIPTVSHPQSIIQSIHEIDGGFRVSICGDGDSGVMLEYPERVPRTVGGGVWRVVDARSGTAEEVEFGEPAGCGGAVRSDVGEISQKGRGLRRCQYVSRSEGWRFPHTQGGGLRHKDALGVEVVMGVVAG